ncbi:polysaccharide deacetylase family protein [Paenibacillus endoradicis]|uniref:polysaccharide deacetylase family protein n=1 Tax=Paenibacillus endoradicis TaxID=2972487 RepID=UPI002158CEAE|nr:polysaccharide deacetylase family protein [Paenibacillus endoradicis]MCR8656565.1 polysaccharide deacetylase family protein [Paenibacillus endoradicis]
MYRKSFIIVLSFIVMIAISLVVIFTMTVNKTTGIAVLMYHDFGYRGNPAVINKEVFADQMNSLAEHEFNVISMEQYVDYMEGKIELPKKSVLITFDDGYEDFYEIAYPILQQHQFPATNFVVVKSSDEPNPEYFPHLTWDQMREMKANGMSFYSHTYDSHIKINEEEDKYPLLANYLEGETSLEYKARVREDLENAQKLLVKELGEQANILAFPYGSYSDELLEVMDEIGIDHAFTIKRGINERGGDGIYYRINAGLSSLDGEGLVRKIEEFYQK